MASRSVQHPSSDRAEPVLGLAGGKTRGLGHLLPQGEKGWRRAFRAFANLEMSAICVTMVPLDFNAVCDTIIAYVLDESY
ncbi:MAG: hypothetical protein E5X63_08275 [Mesorhizobium sp.]|nr:MAG: hypothetical protein E5X63_08275 [Mesorhizobium sp.]